MKILLLTSCSNMKNYYPGVTYRNLYVGHLHKNRDGLLSFIEQELRGEHEITRAAFASSLEGIVFYDDIYQGDQVYDFGGGTWDLKDWLKRKPKEDQEKFVKHNLNASKDFDLIIMVGSWKHTNILRYCLPNKNIICFENDYILPHWDEFRKLIPNTKFNKAKRPTLGFVRCLCKANSMIRIGETKKLNRGKKLNNFIIDNPNKQFIEFVKEKISKL